MRDNIEERVQDLISGKDAVMTDLADMMEIRSCETFDAANLDFEVDGGLFDEKAFGSDWRELAKDYRGQDDYVPEDRVEGKNYGKGGYIRLYAPLNIDYIREGKESDMAPYIATIAVLPAEFRPIISDGNKVYVHPLTKAYSRLICINNRIPKLLESGAPRVLMDNEYAMLRECINTVLNYTDYYLSKGSDSMREIVSKGYGAMKYADTLTEIGDIVTKNLDEAESCLASNNIEGAKWYSENAIIFLNAYRDQCEDMRPIESVIRRAFEFDDRLNEKGEDNE